MPPHAALDLKHATPRRQGRKTSYAKSTGFSMPKSDREADRHQVGMIKSVGIHVFPRVIKA